MINLLKQGISKLQGSAAGKGFIETAGEAIGKAGGSVKTILTTDVFDILRHVRDNKTVSAGIGAPLALAGLGYCYSLFHHGGSTLQDSKRIANISNERSDFFTSVSAAMNTLKMSGAGFALAGIPAFGFLAETVGSKMAKPGTPGFLWLAGSALKYSGLAANYALNGTTKVAGTIIGKAVDVPLRCFGIRSNITSALVKPLTFMYALLPIRGIYKWATIDLTKTDQGLASMIPGAEGVFYDNDPSSPGYLLRRAFLSSQPVREQQNKEGLPGQSIGRMMRTGVESTLEYLI